MPKISVVLSVLERKSNLFENCWKSIVEQDCDDFEICVSVTEAPATRKISEIIAAYHAPAPLHIKTFPLDGPRGRSIHNNIALDMATSPINYVTQDDMILPSNMLSSHIAWHASRSFPIAVYNKIHGAFSQDDQEQEDELWDTLFDPAITPIAGRWKYGSGHSFSYPANLWVRMNEVFGTFWGWEDIDFSYQIHKAGARFYFDREVVATHQPHGGDAWARREKGKDVFYKWLSDRSINREVFRELAGFCPEYGTLRE